MGDAISHTVLPGIVLAFLAGVTLRNAGWISPANYLGWQHALLFGGAMALGVLSAVLTEAVQKLGRVESSAALGVVFTTLFALGLVLVRLAADQVHLDPDCVLYGVLETTAMDLDPVTGLPNAALTAGAVLAINLTLVALFFKELRISAFDPALATALGFRASVMHYALMAVTAATLVSSFEAVGSILVIAMLIVPAATAHLLTDRLGRMIALSVVVAGISAVLGHVLAITLPPVLLSRLGLGDRASLSTSGMMGVAAGLLFVAAALFGPRHGVVSKLAARLRLSVRIVAEDVLGFLYRLEERAAPSAVNLAEALPEAGFLWRSLAVWRLRRRGLLQPAGLGLTDAGRDAARNLVRSHRLWEIYVAKHFELPESHLHATAERAEHFLGEELAEELAQELDRPARDPHGRDIPGQAG
jgi:manganese/zinc/iron transport system permease protein